MGLCGRRVPSAILTLFVLVAAACGGEPATTETTMTTTPAEPEPARPMRLAYGDGPQQFGVLSLPGATAVDGAFPVVVLIHGGFWRNTFDLTLMDPLAADLVDRGYAVWNLEYRRVGDPGGGWPGTLADVAGGIDALAQLAGDHPIDLDRVAVVGHSAGGHLALWAAGRGALAEDAIGGSPAVVPTVAVGQGAVVDLLGAAAAPLGGGAVLELLGGAPDQFPYRYEAARPRLGAGPRMVSVVGSDDGIVPPPYSVDPARPDLVETVEIAGADHFDLIDPTHEAWTAVVNALEN